MSLNVPKMAARLRAARRGAGHKNASAFARAVGVQPNTVYRIEAAEVVPSVATLAEWSRVCGVSADRLLGLERGRAS